ncbi:MAG TPA: hypothetical protein VK887_10395 [Pseudonocardiaceae bacterium]|nr:hypothetical protein [Pseudonocardiaceae bacterium]
MSDLTGKTVGELVKHFRNRIGTIRAVLGGLAGRSAEWAMLHAVERTALETIRFNGYAKGMLLSFAAAPPAGLRDEVPALCRRAGIQL